MFHIKHDIGDRVWVETGEYSASRATIVGIHVDGYYVNFIDKTSDQEDNHSFPVLSRQVKAIDYIGSEK
jgi:hypothetical protein